jgi:hypothetical protein
MKSKGASMRTFTITINPIRIGFVKERSVFRPSPVKKRKGYKYGAEWETPWGKKHGVYDPTTECIEELKRLCVKPMERCTLALEKAQARYDAMYEGMTYEEEVVSYEIPYPQIPSAKRAVMSDRWIQARREQLILQQARQNAMGKIHNVISAYQERDYKTAKGCMHDLNQWFLSLCSVARPEHHIVQLKKQ